MTDPSRTFIYLPGAGGGEVDTVVLRKSLGDAFVLNLIDYPGWKRYAVEGFSAESLVEDLVSHIAQAVPSGPIRIATASLGGHFTYAAALRLQEMGRDIAGLLIIDSFMIASSEPSDGWQSRALAAGIDLLRKGDLAKVLGFIRSRFWRGIYRFAGSRLTPLLRRAVPSGRLPWFLAFDPVAEIELSMRLLIRAVAPWVAALDVNPVPLYAPAILLRTPGTARDDIAWLSRCPEMKIIEIPGQHLTLFDPDKIGTLSDAFVRAASELGQVDDDSVMSLCHSSR